MSPQIRQNNDNCHNFVISAAAAAALMSLTLAECIAAN